MRHLAFQEVTVFTVNEGSVVNAFYGKVDFLKKSKRLKRKRYMVDWSPYFPEKRQEVVKDDSPAVGEGAGKMFSPTLRIAVKQGLADMEEVQEEEAEDSGAGTGLVPSGKIFVCGAPSETEE